MADNEIGEFALTLRELAEDLTGPQMKAVMTVLGVEAKKDMENAVRADIGDLSMSRWRRGNPIDLAARFDDVSNNEIVVTPTPKTRGPWRVITDGRVYGAATDLILLGPVRKKSKTRRARSRGRNQSASAGKDTWRDGEALVEKRTEERALNTIYEEVLVKHLG